MSKKYQVKLRALLSPAEARVFKRLHSPQNIQTFLEALPQHFPRSREAMLSPRGVLAKKTAHCMEGAVFAAAVLAYHGHKPLLLDLRSVEADEDHVVALFKQSGRWGAVSKTNHPVLRWRDPVYQSVRELAMSYFHEYFVWWGKNTKRGFGKKTLRAYSKPFTLARFKPEQWVTARSIDWLAKPLDASPHSPIVSRLTMKNLRRATRIEANAMKTIMWSRAGKKLF